MENKKPIDEYIIKDLPIDGQILGRNSEIRERDYTDCGDSILYPRSDGSLIIFRIGPMLGNDKCNIVELDINENLIKRDYDYSYKNIVTRDNCKCTSDNDEKECEEIGCGFNYAITEKMFKLFDNAYSEALDGLNMFISELTTEYISKKRYRSLAATRRKLYPIPGAAWVQGWDAAIRFAKQVENANYICEQCGKLLTDDIRFDAEFVPFCPKCYDKLFKKGEQL